MHHRWIRRRRRQLLGSGAVEFQHDSAIKNRLYVVGVGEPMLVAEEMLADHNPIEDVLGFVCQDVCDLPDLFPVGAVNRRTGTERFI